MKLDTGTELPEKFVLTKEFKDTYDLINKTDTNLFITGKAGSGKSTLLEYFRQNTNKNFATLAFQGITAIKAKGQTIHSFFKLGPHFLSKDDVKELRDKQVIQNLDTILIDEISMVRADLFDAIDLSLKKNTGSSKIFFSTAFNKCSSLCCNFSRSLCNNCKNVVAFAVGQSFTFSSNVLCFVTV